ncbi:hypothetical protein [Dictyobacter formicarum]|uniref:Uncharacterized protein n=1 Tax=Dictyobacter formicarum TaxID=2778368 RepID=A0ABQ3VMK3_9CHLR|nr:hypothetical protein [Dictyobacter formicarum]GHO87455.1 hypothetical protein KSZ_54610 [Dictyobacter formicarum]
MKIFRSFRAEEMTVKESEQAPHSINFADDIMEIHRTGGNVDIRKLHPEMTEQEAADYLRTLIANHVIRL